MKVPLENVWIKIKVEKILKKVTGIENINSLVSTALTLDLLGYRGIEGDQKNRKRRI